MSTFLAPSIFNDVLGPVMRGPSSSHSAASVRIARLARDLAGGDVKKALIEFDPNGSLATTHESQGSDIGLYAGLLGWEADDPRIANVEDALKQSGIETRIQVRDIGATHPNTYRLTVWGRLPEQKHTLEADSLGGGMIIVNAIDDHPVRLQGDYRVTLLKGVDDSNCTAIKRSSVGFSNTQTAGDWLVVEAQDFLDAAEVEQLDATEVRYLDRVLPVPSFSGMRLPFDRAQDLAGLGKEKLERTVLSSFALEYESARSGWSHDEVTGMMSDIRDVMRSSINAGLRGTDWHDRILGNQSRGFRNAWQSGQLLDCGMLNRMILYVTALMEAKSAMEVIVAAPTAGSCGTFPATCLAAADSLKLSDDVLLPAMLSGGLIGIFVANQSSFAAEVGG
ncbi:MAG: L-serine ammonia-lyase, iron-sulfur-dependent, subunit alpha, partial [Planctomycetota bacterium]